MWTFQSVDGKQSQGMFPTIEAAWDAYDADFDFRRELGDCELVEVVPTKEVQFMPDVQPHYNVAFEKEVTGRRHLRALQREHGTQDYEPIAKTNNLVAEHRATWKRHGRKSA